jgi:protein-glutamine gamma-glutamyltransferase
VKSVAKRWARLDSVRITFIAPVAVFALSILLHVATVPAWCLVVVLGAGLWRFAVIVGAVPEFTTRRAVRLAFGAAALAAFVAVFASFKTINGLAAGSALLCLMGALKLLETRSARDEQVVIGVALFLLLAACLGGQQLTRAPLYIAIVWAACTSFALLAQRQSNINLRQAMQISGRALLLAVPVAVLFFMFFPRVAGQFWGLPGASAGVTGLGDEMQPNSIDKLIEDYEPTFRVTFSGAIPRPSERYWRGPVLTQFDGFTWRRAPGASYREPGVELLGPRIEQRITLEPTNRRWWFALETVAASPRRDVFLSPDRQLFSIDPVAETTSYSVVSHLQSRPVGTLSTLGRRLMTALPGDRNPRTRAFAAALRARHPDDAALANAMLEHYRSGGYTYSLEPGQMGLDSVDEFLFDKKIGFCGHFASSFTTVMRAAGVPARVVTGYLGGEWNPIGGYLIVRNSDAHAWSEVWLENRGWIRIDPTGVVEPSRLDRGVIDLLPDSVSTPTRLLYQSAWASRIVLAWDSANHWWRQNVVEFDLQSQLRLLDRLGLGSAGWQALGLLLAIGFIAWMTFIALALRRMLLAKPVDRIGKLWLKFCDSCTSVTAPRAPAEPPLEFAQRVGGARPDLGPAALEIAHRYNSLRYERPNATAGARAQAIDEFARAVRKFAA